MAIVLMAPLERLRHALNAIEPLRLDCFPLTVCHLIQEGSDGEATHRVRNLGAVTPTLGARDIAFVEFCQDWIGLRLCALSGKLILECLCPLEGVDNDLCI